MLLPRGCWILLAAAATADGANFLTTSFFLAYPNSSALVLLRDSWAYDAACRVVEFQDVARVGADGILEVHFSPAFCAPFDNPLICLSRDGDDTCQPKAGTVFRAMVDKYDQTCAAALNVTECVTQVITRTDAGLRADLATGLANDPQLQSAIIGALLASDAHTSEAIHAANAVAMTLNLKTYVGPPIRRRGVVVQGFPTDLLGSHANNATGFQTVPLLTNNNPDDCRGITLEADHVILKDVASSAALACGSAEASRYVRDFVIEIDTVSEIGCRGCRLALDNTASNTSVLPPHVVFHVIHPQLDIVRIIVDADAVVLADIVLLQMPLDLEVVHWTPGNDIGFWATAVQGITHTRVVGVAPALQLASSSDAGPWPVRLFNASELLPSVLNINGALANCPSSTLANNIVVGLLGGVVGLVVTGLVAVLLECATAKSTVKSKVK